MLHHCVPSYLWLIASHLQSVVCNPLRHVVILPSPAPKLIGKPVEFSKLLDANSSNSPEDGLVGKLVLELVNRHGHVPGLGRAGVEITVILREKIYIMEDATVPAVILHCLCESNIHQHRPVEEVLIRLVDDVDPVVQVLHPQEGVDMAQEDSKLTGTVSVWNNNGNIVAGAAVCWAVLSTW